MKKAITTTLALMLTLSAVMNSASAAQNEEVSTDTTNTQTTTDERVYCLASVSKVYVTAAVMQLVDQGLVDLDAPVTEYIPDFTMADPRYTEITVRMLMNHTSGIMGTTLLNEGLYEDYDVDLHEVLLNNLATQCLKADPGAYAAYCNDGFGLLQLIVENVSGMSYTDYITNELAGSIGLSHTGTPCNAYEIGNPIDVYVNNLPYDYEYCMDVGTGGVVATASDVAMFGSSFFTGSESLISQELVDEMELCWTDSDNEYLDGCGLGWDYVEMLQYEQAGVQIVGKGGDVLTMHSQLMVAPENEISVAVLSSGGNSTYCMLMCEALMNIALEEQGIEVQPLEPREVEIVDDMPEELEQYAGFFCCTSPMPGLGEVSFSDNGQMLLEITMFDGRTAEYHYRYTDCGGFVEVNDSGSIRANQRILFFERSEDGQVYIAGEQYTEVPEVGSYINNSYVAQRLEANPISDELQAVWEGYCAVPYAAYNNRYSSSVYDSPFEFMMMPDGLPGYVLAGTGLGARLLRIEDDHTAVAVETMPCSSSRDLIDLYVNEDGTLNVTTGNSYVSLAAIPEFTSDITEVELTSDCASWYRISDEMAYEMINVDCPEDAVIYVYNKFFEPVYTTHYLDAADSINLPEGGFIVFLGQTGESVTVS